MNRIATLIVLLVLSGTACSQPEESELKKTSISQDELLTWTVMGKGEVGKSGPAVSMQESDDSKGIMLVSPDVYGPDQIVRYKVLALTPATVLVALLSVSDEGEATGLEVPEDFDGSLGLFTREKENYFFAFKNAPHNLTPFVRKSPNAEGSLGTAAENSMIAGVYYDVEVGAQGGKLWLSIDGEKVIETTDPEPLAGGHIALRIRGTAGFRASCLIRDLEILSNK